MTITEFAKHLVSNRRFRLALTLAAVLMLSSLVFSPAILRATTPCRASTPVGNPYTATVCINQPADGSTVAGLASIAASVSVTGNNPGISQLLFYLNDEIILTDFQAPYTFELPTTHWTDGARSLRVEAIMRDGFITQRADVGLIFNNGISQVTPNTRMFTPAPGTTPVPGRAFTLAAVGDGADGSVNSDGVTDMIASWNPNMFLYLGDVYEKGLTAEFHNFYGTSDSYFGRFRSITNPTIGNHEYENGVAPGYYDYWDNVPDYYSFNTAGWHIISLNMDGNYDQMDPGTTQYDWLVQDLTANTAICTITYWHHPRYSVGPRGDEPAQQAIWSLLAQRGVDVVFTGHDHSYQRWYELNGAGELSTNGITQFVVGSGGHGIQAFVRTDTRLAAGVDTTPQGLGALRMQLNQHGAGFQFINIQGALLNSGSMRCGGAPTDTLPPTAPTALAATSKSMSSVNLTWTPAVDNVGVTGYDVYRNGILLTTAGPLSNYTDITAAGGTTYQYQIRARDADGNVSPLSNLATVTTPSVLFSDNFESGSLSQWINSGLVVQQQEVYSGTYAARGTSTGLATYAQKQLGGTLSEAFYAVKFKVVSLGANSVYLLKFRNAANGSILGLYVSSTGKLSYRNDAGATSVSSQLTVSQGAWHEVQVRVLINGAAGQVEVWYDGVRVGDLSRSESLGTLPVGRIYLGENSSSRIYDVAFDDVAIGPNFINPSITATPTPTSVLPTATATRTGTATRTPTSTPEATFTSTPGTPGETATATDTSTPGGTLTTTPTLPTETATLSATATETSMPTSTATATASSTTTATPTITNTPVPTSTHTATSTSTSTYTATPTFTATSTPTSTHTSTATSTITATSTSTATSTITATSTPVTSFTFTSIADAYVNQSKPGTNYGDRTNLRIDGSPSRVMTSYLRFQVQGLPAPRTRAILRLFTSTSSTIGYQVRAVSDNTWVESSINYSNAPPLGSVLGSSGALTAGTWTSVDITPFISGNGTFSLALTTSSGSPIDCTSREGGANAPQLVVEIAP